jgi:hypothetical protein
MRVSTKISISRKVAVLLAASMLFEMFYPTAALALTGGPGSPEFSSFEPVSTTSMVSDFSGDFNYNLPVLDVPGSNGGGYSMSLSYHAGASPEEESSWVGYGWTLNPGAINRNKRGFPDDSKGNKVNYYNQVPANWTVSLGASFGSPEFISVSYPLSLNSSIRYNNYTGFGTTVGAGISIRKGLVSLGYSVSDGQGSFSLKVNPAALLNKSTKEQDKVKNSEKYKKADGTQQQTMLADAKALDDKSEKNQKLEKLQKYKKAASFISNLASSYGVHAMAEQVSQFAVTQYNGQSYDFNFSVDGAVFPIPPVKGEVGFSANYTRQENVPIATHASYGYLYSGLAYADDNSVMDYYMEKESSFNKRDKYLSLPFSNADLYSLSGEGLGGSFRMHSAYAGHFRPNSVTSNTSLSQVGAEYTIGVAFGIGANIGVGSHDLTVHEWGGGNVGSYEFADNGDQKADKYFFRFNGDLGGDVLYGTSDAAAGADIVSDNSIPGLKSFHPNLSSTYFSPELTSVNDGTARSGRSSYIGYHTNAEMTYTASGVAKNYERYDQYDQHDQSITPNKYVNRDDATIADGIGEIVSFNEDGNRYVYGLPVYARNEKNMQYGLAPLASGDLHNHYLAYKNIHDSKYRVGEEHNYPYASSYLLTEITTPDFVDRDMNGPDDTDFGGYTKFNYNMRYGSLGSGSTKKTGGTWYKWRIPYQGLQYNPVNLFDNKDDLGSFSSGEKEVYYLQSVETKTHIAVFVTNKTNYTFPGTGGTMTIAGTMSDRQDAIDANADDVEAAKNPAAAQGSHKLEYLEKIALYAKEKTSSGYNYKLIKTTNFSYDYSAFTGAPNTTSGVGKLTLKKVWFEYEGIVNARISPYTFEYQYPATTYPSVYSGFDNYGSAMTQSPVYSPFLLDGWGNYQDQTSAIDEARHDKMKSWVNQVPASTFDPAAWQLKVIKLPSGGEIHVQYEQKEYSYVQDRRALSMVSLRTDIGNASGNASALTDKLYLNVEDDLGISSAAEKQQLVAVLADEFRDKKIYFKFLYGLLAETSPGIGGHCNSDYISGYTTVSGVAYDATYNRIYVQLGGAFSYSNPYNVCTNKVKSILGRLKPFNNCNAEEAGVGESSVLLDVAQQLLSKLSAVVSLGSEPICLTMNPALSYLRIPSTRAKLGGGIRVKRILMYDNGIESGDAALFGSEYIYKTVDGKSSGVAINEPSSFREENALVGFLEKRSDQNLWQKATAGLDREQFEGPIGESILPPPSIGYSRVVIKNIHSGKTNTGFAVNEFFTAKDYPFDKNYNGTFNAVDYTGITKEEDWFPLYLGIVNISINNLWLSQGYRFIMNDMHGQAKAKSVYAGDPAAANTVLSSHQEYTYYEPGENISMMYDIDDIRSSFPGKEVEVAFENRTVEDVSKNGFIEVDADVGLLFIPLPFASFSANFDYMENKLNTHVSTKVIHYPAIQKSVLSAQDGIVHLTQNIAFNPHTGKPAITQTTDGYDQLALQQYSGLSTSTSHNGIYKNYTMQASQQYTEMGQKALNERAIVTPDAYGITMSLQNASDPVLVFATDVNPPCDAMKWFVRGDLVKVVVGTTPVTRLFHVDAIVGTNLYLKPANNFNLGASITTGNVTSVEVIRSGRTNQLGQTAGSLTTYGNPSVVDHPIPSATLALITAFVSNLDNVVNHNSSTLAIPTGLQFKNACGVCKSTPTISITDRTTAFGGVEGEPLVQVGGSVTIHFTVPVETGDCSGGTSIPANSNSVVSIENPVDPFLHDTTVNTFLYAGIGSFTGSSSGCATVFPFGTVFSVDPANGNILYTTPDNPCNPKVFTCAPICTPFAYKTLDVVASSASVFQDNWPFLASLYPGASGLRTDLNNYETGAQGKWRNQSAFAYREAITGGSKASTTERNYNNAGVYPLTLFNWKVPAANEGTKWIKLNTVTQCSPNGEATEEQDILGIYSSSKFGYKGTMPYLVAKNAPYNTVQFESFENNYSGKFEDGVAVPTSGQWDNAVAHSGLSSYKLINSTTTAQSTITFNNIDLTNQVYNNGLSVKVWVKDPGHSDVPLSLKIGYFITSTAVSKNYTFNKIGQSGEWSLYEAVVLGGSLLGTSGGTTHGPLTPKVICGTGTTAIWIDDVRIQPYNAQVMTYVYDVKTLRVLASFDDQHFGLFYQYNAEGKLVYKSKETERGMKTIMETQYHVPLVSR